MNTETSVNLSQNNNNGSPATNSMRQQMQTPFMKEYVKWYESTNGKPFQFPLFNRQSFDIEKLWTLVRQYGGSSKVTLQKQWAEIGRKFDPPTYMTNLSTIVKNIYERFLLEYEKVHFASTAMPGPGSTRYPRRKRKRKDEQNRKSQRRMPMPMGIPMPTSIEDHKKKTEELGNLKRELEQTLQYIAYLKEEHEIRMSQIHERSEQALREMADHAAEIEHTIVQYDQECERLIHANAAVAPGVTTGQAPTASEQHQQHHGPGPGPGHGHGNLF
eukprot:TRINITY_DN1353_c1_g1_i1.p2 TRINITY_DN1353_c1_g1~~TRINITY_DN1353_c1_g1_i1.p2  ORF type:complete len:273 (-),score=24.18 TRINITY_DN1353_c1_g1_i1:493-1311(-)